MEPSIAIAPEASPPGPRFTVRGVLGEAWTIWSRNAGPLLALALALGAPIAALTAVSKARAVVQSGPLTLLSGLVTMLFSLATTGALALAGARALRREPLHVGTLAIEGLRRAWLTFKVLFLSAWAVVLVAVVLLFLLVVVSGPRFLGGTASDTRAISEPRFFVLMVGLTLSMSFAMVRLYPALPAALARPALGARAAMRHGKELGRGARLRILLLAFLFQMLGVPLTAVYNWSLHLAPGLDQTLALAAYGVLTAVLASYTHLAPPLVHRALAVEKGERSAELDELGRVFD